MEKVTELKPTKLIAVEVAPDATNYRFGHKVFGETVWNKDLCYDTECNVWNVGNAILPELKYKILGEVTKDKIGFDVTKLPDIPLSTKEANELLGKDDKIVFRKLLSANGLYFENPLDREKKAYFLKGSENSWGHDDLKRWQDFEDKLLKGKLLILNIK